MRWRPRCEWNHACPPPRPAAEASLIDRWTEPTENVLNFLPSAASMVFPYPSEVMFMMTTESLVFWVAVALVGTAAWQFFGKRVFGVEARERRRRSRSYGRAVSRRRGPGVRMAVRVARP